MYKIVTACEEIRCIATKTVEDEVNELKKQGWIEQGGVSVATTKYGYDTFYTIAQAMVKKED